MSAPRLPWSHREALQVPFPRAPLVMLALPGPRTVNNTVSDDTERASFTVLSVTSCCASPDPASTSLLCRNGQRWLAHANEYHKPISERTGDDDTRLFCGFAPGQAVPEGAEEVCTHSGGHAAVEAQSYLCEVCGCTGAQLPLAPSLASMAERGPAGSCPVLLTHSVYAGR